MLLLVFVSYTRYMQASPEYFVCFPYRCLIDGLDSGDPFASAQNGSWIRNTTLLQGDGFGSQSSCQSQHVNQTHPLLPTNRSAMACSRWVYDTSQYKTTIVSDVSKKLQWDKDHSQELLSFYPLYRVWSSSSS